MAAAAATYTLDADAAGNIVINGDEYTKLGGLLSPTHGPYNKVETLIDDQKKVNYLDAIKDGTNVHQLMALNIYDMAKGYPTFPDDLHHYENGLLEQMKGNLSHKTWLKTKKDSKLNLIQSYYVFWESGLGYESFIELLQKEESPEKVTFGSYIDPLSKPGKIWPPRGDTIRITPQFMKQFGFGRSSIEAKTLVDEIGVGMRGRAFNYQMNIACGTECSKTCTFEDKGDTVIDANEKYFKGNAAKNALVKSDQAQSGLKTKLIVAKGWGDKVQVMLYYMYYKLKQNAIMITCDFVVFCFCITLNIPCVYTGVYNRDVAIPHQEVAVAAEKKDKGSYYSILHFKPGTPLENAIQNYKNTIIRIANENQEFIDNVSELVSNPNTKINVQGTDIVFNVQFYQTLVDDMKKINRQLELLTGAMYAQQNIDTVVSATDDLKKNFLIIPMFKFIKNGTRITFLQTKLYTSNKELKLSINEGEYQKKNSETFYAIASRFKTGGAITRAQARAAIGQRNGIMTSEQKELFPTRDRSEKPVRFLPEDIHEVQYDIANKKAPLFLEDGFGEEQQGDLQGKFDINMYRAIESLSAQNISNENVMYNVNHQGGGRKATRRRNVTRRRQKGGAGIDETLFETLYTLYVYRAQYDIELHTPDQSINTKVLRELYNDYPKSTLRTNDRMTLKNLTGEKVVTYTVTGGPVNTRKQPVHTQNLSTRSPVTGMTSANRLINSSLMQRTARPVRSYGGRITRRKKRYHRRTRK